MGRNLWGTKAPKSETVTELLQRYQKEADRQYTERGYKNRDKGAR